PIPPSAAAKVAGRNAASQGAEQPSPSTTASSGDVSRRAPNQAQLPTALVAPVPTAVIPKTGAPNASIDRAPAAGSSESVAAVSFPSERGIVAAGGRHSCGLDANGLASCWGSNDQGQLGDGTRNDHAEPAVVAGDLAFTQLSAGASHTCGVSRDGDVYCWGNNERGQLGDATTLERDTPIRVGASGPFK